MHYSIAILAVSLLAFLPSVGDRRQAPKDAATTEDIVKAVEPFKGFGSIQYAQFNRRGRHVFALWYCPFSGRAACYLHAYYYDLEKAHWIRFVDRLVEGSHDLSAEMPSRGDVLILRDTEGEITVKESVAKVPQSK
jgi:hypothetical protein